MNPRYEALANILKEEGTLEKLLNCTSEEAVVVLREEYQLDFTVEEMDEVAAGMKAAMEQGDSEELSLEDLENVAGGGNSTAYYAGYYIGKAVIAFGIGVGTAAAIVSLGW